MNKYQIIECIGWEEYRQVYKYKNTKTHVTVAIKTLWLQSDGDYGVPCLTIRKICLLKEIDHPNVARLVNIFYNKSKTRVHLMFEYADMDLRKFMITNPVRATDRRFIQNVLKQILRGVSCYHSIKVAHGNLNPFNVIINCANLTAKIIDLDMTIHPSYKAPELLCDSFGTDVEVSRASDMFSIGCIFAEMLMKRPLYDAQSEY
ncbi:Serine/threonine protein kinase [Parasponia andersonii]|uniref:Serine/threonine protein kinase n=1 Tax=Parasponia andersonii TaxID=3476 RepID=A0A2P5E0Y6_PARAD|nr:Serine/threonine protein kinase [Parasponia andersonii]